MKSILPYTRGEYLTLMISAFSVISFLVIWFRG